MNLHEFHAAIRQTIGIGGEGTQLGPDEITQALHLCMVSLNRFFPRERIATHIWTKSITDESFTSNHNTAVELANKPLEFDSETVTSDPAGTTYTKDTDYEMDYRNGTITVLSTGSMANSTGFLISYNRDPSSLDISGILTESLNIHKIDVRDSNDQVRDTEGWEVWGDFLTIYDPSSSYGYQFSDNDHINIWYYGQHTEPTATASGSFPRFLDQVMIVGAAGYALVMEGLQRKHQAVTDLASGRTSIGNIAAIHTAIGTVVTELGTTQGDINIALDLAATAFAAVAAFITSATAELALANAELDKYDASGGPIDDSDTNLSSAITALADIDTILDKVTTHLTGVSSSAKAAFDAIDAELDKMVTSGTQAIAELASATDNADALLALGEALLNAIGNSPNPALDYIRFVESKIAMSQTYLAEGALRASFGTARLNEGTGYSNIAQTFINEATARLSHAQTLVAIVNSYLATADRHTAAGAGYLGVAEGYLSQARTKIQEGLGSVQLAAQRVSEANVHISEMNTRISQITTYLAEADRYQTSSDRETVAGNELERQGMEFIVAYQEALQARQYRVQRERRNAPQHPAPPSSRGARSMALVGNE